MLDLAYAEFAGEEGEALMRAALELDNAVVVRTFSKAYGLAGLRVGYAIGPVGVIRAMRGGGLGVPFRLPRSGSPRRLRLSATAPLR